MMTRSRTLTGKSTKLKEDCDKSKLALEIKLRNYSTEKWVRKLETTFLFEKILELE